MKLDVLSTAPKTRPWYADGLNFTCTQCGNCCTGGPGFVWITREEIVRLAEYLKMTPEETVEKYCRKLDGKFSLKERRNGDLFDCVFLQEACDPSNDDDAAHGTHPVDAPTQAKRICSVYPVRPLQCRTWPFWPENLRNKENWDRSSGRCPGINQGRLFTPDQIHAVRDAADWPKDPPGSGD